MQARRRARNMGRNQQHHDNNDPPASPSLTRRRRRNRKQATEQVIFINNRMINYNFYCSYILCSGFNSFIFIYSNIQCV